MKAAVFQGVGQPLQIADCPDPEPGPREVVLKVGRCGICGSDLHMTEPGALTPPAGAIMGHEFAGEVVALGRDVTKLRVGDRVTAMPITGCGACAACRAGEPSWCEKGLNFLAGGYAQYARAGEDECLRLPPGLSESDGALVEPLAVGLHGARMADLKGAKVTVIGGGPIGLAATFWARRFGAACIEVVEPSKERGEMALGMGADRVRAPAPAAEPGLAQPGVDPTRIAYVGHDFGAMYGCILLALDHRISYGVLMAGAGVKHGAIYGASDDQAAFIKDKPVHIKDVVATIYHILGIDPEMTVLDRAKRPVPIAHGGKPITEILS